MASEVRSGSPVDRVEPTVVADSRVDDCIERATGALLAEQRRDGHWVFELEADATIPAEYVLLRRYLGEPDPALEQKIANYLRRNQAAHGGWPLFHDGPFNISASVKAYFALKVIGDSPDAPHMRRGARSDSRARRRRRRATCSRACCSLCTASFPWQAVPTIPVEIMYLPRWFPFHLFRISYWGRTVLAPLLVLQAMKPSSRHPHGVTHRRTLSRRVRTHSPRAARVASVAPVVCGIRDSSMR